MLVFDANVYQCFEAAKAVIKNFIEVLAPSGYMRYSADGGSHSFYILFALAHLPAVGHFVFSSFASAFLLKVCYPSI